MKKPSASASKLKELIQHAIQDLEITPQEYQEIMDCAAGDAHIDQEEKALLSQFQAMLSNGTITRVKSSKS